MQTSILNTSRAKFINATAYLREAPKFSKGEHGMERVELPLDMSRDDAARLLTIQGTPDIRIHCGDLAWRGRVENVTADGDGAILVGYGLWSLFDDLQDYTELWSTTNYNHWEAITEEQISTVTDTFQTDTKDRLYIAPRKGGTIADGDRGGLYIARPSDASDKSIVAVMFEYEVAGSDKWKASIRRWASRSFGTPTEVWSPTLTSYNTYRGAVCTSFTGSPLLTAEFESEVAQTTLGTAINAVSTTLAPTSLRVSTTSGTAVAAPGSTVITPASMTNIVNGMKLLYGATTTSLEKVTVTATTGTTFTATFKNTHLVGATIKSTDDWAVPEVDTTTTAGYAAGAGTVITPTSMANIVNGMVLVIGWGGEAEEEVTVTAVTSTTFTATLVYGHASGEKVKNGANSYSVRPQSMTGIIAGMNLEIGGRNSEIVNVASVTSTHFTATFQYGHPGDSTVVTAKRQTVTPASMTHIAKGREYRIGNEAGVTNSEPEKVRILETTGSTFTAEFDNPHGSTDTVVRIYSGDYNAWLKLTNVRVVTSIENMVSTTISSGISSGTQTVTPASMTGIYVGQLLVVDGTGVGDFGEMVEVTAITATTFTATFAMAHSVASGNITVKGLIIYADEIARHVVTQVAAANAQLSTSTVLIESPGLDMTDALYEDQSARDVLLDLTKRGDDQTPPRTWSVGVWDDALHFWPRGTGGKTYYLDATAMRLSRSLESIVTTVQAAYMDKGRRQLLRTAAAASAAALDAWAVERRIVVDVKTTSATLAETARDAVLEDRSRFIPAADFEFEDIYTAQGAWVDPALVRPGDSYVVIRNLPAPLPSLQWRMVRSEYSATGLRLELEGEPGTIESLLAKALRTSDINGPRTFGPR